MALELRRYNTRHDGVLDVIHTLVSSNLPSDYQVIADLPDQAPFIFPPHIATTDLRPDLVVWSNTRQEVILFELTVCFESNFDNTQQRKREKYLDLMETIQRTHFRAQLVPLQVGSRGFLDLRGFEVIQNLCTCQKKEWKKFLADVSRAAIWGSHHFWCTRNWKDTPRPPCTVVFTFLACLYLSTRLLVLFFFCILQD